MLRQTTDLIHSGNAAATESGYVASPIYRGSTVLYKTVAELEVAANDLLKLEKKKYGRFGNPNSQDFETLLTKIENGFGTVCCVSGLAAISTAILSAVQSGDHILIPESVYYPTRRFCNSLQRFNIEVEYYNPLLGEEIASKILPNTKLVYIESPGSHTFEIQDIPAITRICRAKGIVTIVDNTWATPLFLKPLDLGANISIHSATKFITGHADSILGAIVCDNITYNKVRLTAIDLGQKAGSEDIYSGLKGLRTLSLRMEKHDKNARDIAEWLTLQTAVQSVIHPALTTHPNHDIWLRDFTGASSVFMFSLKTNYHKEQCDRFLNSLRLFGLGHSYGGYESLIVPSTSSVPNAFRIHVGLEDARDLKDDLLQALRSCM